MRAVGQAAESSCPFCGQSLGCLGPCRAGLTVAAAVAAGLMVLAAGGCTEGSVAVYGGPPNVDAETDFGTGDASAPGDAATTSDAGTDAARTDADG